MVILIAIMDPRGAPTAMTPTGNTRPRQATQREAERSVAKPSEAQTPRPPMWELAECTCPDYCERDHELD
jgi:hypothetical protein